MKISIIIPVYNVEEYIEKTIRSIIEQQLSDVMCELIIVDDGTQDNSILIAKNLLNINKIDHKIISQKNSGVSAARNNGLKHAKGDYILFLDSDDLLDSSFLNNLSQFKGKDDIIFWSFNNIDKNGKILKRYCESYNTTNNNYDKGIEVLKEILIKKNHLIWTGSAIYSKNFLKENDLMFNICHINGEDQEFIFSSLVFANKVSYISNTLSYYLIREKSISTSFKMKKFDSVIALENVRNIIVEIKKNEKELIDAFNSYIIENFLYVYKSGLLTNSSKEMVNILTNLNDLYPMLNSRTIKSMKEYKSKYSLKKIEVNIAKKNMLLYGIIFRFYRKMKG